MMSPCLSPPNALAFVASGGNPPAKGKVLRLKRIFGLGIGDSPQLASIVRGRGRLAYMLSKGIPFVQQRLSIPSALIFDSKVDRGIPSLAAAPAGPDTCPPLSRSAD